MEWWGRLRFGNIFVDWINMSDSTKKSVPKYWIHEVIVYISNRLEEVSIALNELSIELEYYDAINDTASPTVTKMCIQQAIAFRDYTYLKMVLEHLDTMDNSKQYTLTEIFGNKLSVHFTDNLLLKTSFIQAGLEQKQGEE